VIVATGGAAGAAGGAGMFITTTAAGGRPGTFNTSSASKAEGADGGSGGGAAYRNSTKTLIVGSGGSDGADGGDAVLNAGAQYEQTQAEGGTGQGTTTREFGETTGDLYSGGGAPLRSEAHDVGGRGAYRHHGIVLSHAAQEISARELGIVALLLVDGVRRRARVLLAGGDVEATDVVPALGVRLGGRVALSFSRVYVEDAGMVASAQLAEGPLDGEHVVAVGEVAVIEAEGAEVVVPRRPARLTQLGQAAVKAAGVRRYRPFVVVDDEDHVAALLGGPVEPLEREAAREGAVADDGDDVVGLAEKVARLGKAAGEARGR